MASEAFESRYYVTETYEAYNGLTLRDEYVPYRYEVNDDNIIHTAAEGDTWWNLAFRYYHHISENASRLWWVICDFQPQPVVDPTVAIAPGRIIIVPPPIVVATEILGVGREVFL